MIKSFNLPILSFLLLFGSACSNMSSGELVGTSSKKIKPQHVPYGMVYIPGGTFILGQSDEDITFSQIAQNRQVTISPFYMDETEISNSEYRQFVNWVRDSIAITNYLQDESFFMENADGSNDSRFIDWDKVSKSKGGGIWGSKDQAVNDRIQGMYYQGEDRIFGRNELDVRLLKYHYELFDIRAAAANKDKGLPRSTFINRDTVAIYPDTLVWLADFSYAQNEPMVEGYFSHPAFDNYPVVGITWRQANAFNVWRTRLYEHAVARSKSGKSPRLPYQLPSEAQWEYAARGGRNGTPYPWGGPYIRSAKGCLMANFKPGRGNYADDGGAYTMEVNSFFPNDFGLYNMAGNVAEWTSSSFSESANTFVHDMNPTYSYDAKPSDPDALKRKVIRGGSWKDIGYFLQNSARTYEYQDNATSYIGFRSVTAFPGSDMGRR